MATTKKDKAPPETKEIPVRDEVLNRDLIEAALKKHGLPLGGETAEMANRLEKHYEHEWRKKRSPIGEMADCEAPLNDRGDVDLTAKVGCGRASPSALDACPFCGQSETYDGRTDAAEPAPKAEANPEPEPAEEPTKPAAKNKPAKAKSEPTAKPEGEPAPAATKVSEDKPALVKTTSANVRKVKGTRAVASLEVPTIASDDETTHEPAPATEPSPSETTRANAAAAPVVAESTESTTPESGATVADLDMQVERFKKAVRLAETTNAVSFWEQGDALREIIDHKLWCLVRNEGDGAPVYRSLGEFCSRALDISQPTAYAFKAIATSFERQVAENLGFSRMKALVQAKDLPGFDGVLQQASKRTTDGQGFVLSTRELHELIAAEKRLLTPPKPTVAPAASAPPSAMRDDGEDEDEEPESDEEPVEFDADGVVTNGSGRAIEGAKPARAVATPKTVSISLADPRFTVELFIKGSNVKRAKKLEDGCHGSFSGTNGVKGRVEVVIQEGAELALKFTLDSPF